MQIQLIWTNLVRIEYVTTTGADFNYNAVCNNYSWKRTIVEVFTITENELMIFVSATNVHINLSIDFSKHLIMTEYR